MLHASWLRERACTALKEKIDKVTAIVRSRADMLDVSASLD